MNNSINKWDNNPLDLIIWESEAIVKLKENIKKVSPHNIPVLIKWETWTWKELVANAIHLLSNRSDKPLIVANCWAISPELALSDFFWHSKWAFTWASKNRQWYFCAANEWSLFLDELWELISGIQASLLRVLEWKEIMKLWTEETIKTDARIIAATNKDLQELIRKWEFREDLFHRLNTCIIDIPSLRERPEDIWLLIKYFLKKACEFHKNDTTNPKVKNLSISSQAINDLEAYSWPGNIRELINVINYLTIMICDNSEISSKDIKELKPELYKKDWINTYIKKKEEQEEQSFLEKADLDFVITNLKKVSLFIKTLNWYKERKKVFTWLIIRYYLWKYNRNKNSTAERFWLSPIIFWQILEKYKPFIENKELDSFFDIVPVFWINLKDAKKRLNKLNNIFQAKDKKTDNSKNKEKKTNKLSDLNNYRYLKPNQSTLLNPKETSYYSIAKFWDFKNKDDNPSIEELKNNNKIQEFIKVLKEQEEPIRAFIWLFIRFHLNNQDTVSKTAKFIWTTKSSIGRYKPYYNSNYLDKYIDLINLFPINYYKAKKIIREISWNTILFKRKKEDKKINDIKIWDIIIPREIYELIWKENIKQLNEKKLKLIIEKLSIEEIKKIWVKSLISMSLSSLKTII